MDRKPTTALWISWLVDGIVFVFDPIVGILFFLFDWKRLIDEETKPTRPFL